MKKKELKNIHCANCQLHLLRVLIDDPDADVDFTFVVDCDRCGDKSLEHTFHGLLKWYHTDHNDIVDIKPDNEKGIVNFKSKYNPEKRYADD